MQGGIKKEYRTLHDKPVLLHSLHQFYSSKLFYKIVITLPKNDIKHVKKLVLSQMQTDETVEFIAGGETRQESVFLALLEFEETHPDFILIHDGARPWIHIDLIHRVLASTQKYDACIPVVEVPDALKEIDEKGIILKGLSRAKIKGAQTPQGFAYDKLLKAHQLAKEKKMEALDDAEVYGLLYQPIVTVPGDTRNRKITYQHDIPEYK
ncbi:MAG: 2-C-methyl-D-erythritol 4-phosphate cytidylyltransferase [Spirochaetales bacterium]|nr:2-C-methyl-D-erythritol 4-phosphate cytidylyltransferase [Spirochaetales bacterium]